MADAIRTHKPAIILELKRGRATDKAARVPQEWDEGFAQLCSRSRSCAYTKQRWEQIINDGSLFLDQWGGLAASLGWRLEAVFGVDATAPVWRYDRMGLVPLLEGRPVIALTSVSARIDCGSDIATTYYRTNNADGAVPLWTMKC
ncbi:MAG: hypothetical protein FWF24_04845 [Alphaproteobacteria bacterium]|nr:hypothetical protein [Alphaproteobacteria bacterium]